MKRTILFSLALAAFLALPSCEWVSNLIHDDEVVARIDKHKL